MPGKSNRPTIKQVAAAAGVSTQTVSRVMNDRPDVSPETRERVLKVIEEMGYQPSALARSLIQQRSYTLGVVTAGLKYIGPSRTLSGITNAAEHAGYSLLLMELPSFDTNHVLPILQGFISRHVDGIIWAVQEVGQNRDWLKSPPVDLGIPIVFLTMEPREGISIVSVNNYLGARMVMEHLFEQGYRHIGHISGPLDWWEARQRMAAWKDTLKEKGIPVQRKPLGGRQLVIIQWSESYPGSLREVSRDGCRFCGQRPDGSERSAGSLCAQFAGAAGFWHCWV